MNKLRLFFKLHVLLAFGFTSYRVLGNTQCDTCKCCKDSTCPIRLNDACTAGCIDGYTGETCKYTCPDNCESCHQHSADICLQCNAGYYIGWRNGQWVGNCSLTCPNNCISCLSDTYCSSCKDGYYSGLDNSISYSDCSLPCYSGCKACKSYDVCTECKDGYFGHSKTGYSCHYNCSDGCIDNICNKEIGSCDCKTTYWGQKCSEKCRPECKTCESYDVCSECLNGFYGLFCEYNCSKGCIDIMCNKDNGTCDCKSTYWGQKCEKTCSKGCNFSACSNKTGKCIYGCKIGFTGDSCDTCINGYFDENCSSICPDNCLSDKNCSNNCSCNVCNQLTGECDIGCEDNYWGRHCDKACSRNCKDVKGRSNCDQSNGHCLIGCKDGYFTKQCDKKCSSNCFNLSCDSTGDCLYGCIGDYEAVLCLQAKLQMTDKNGGRAAIIAGSVSGALILIIGITVAVVFLKRRKRTNEESKEENTTVVYCNIDNRGHPSHPETKEVETNQSHTAQTSNRENSPFAQKQSETKSISNVYEKIVRRADSREYSTLSYDTTRSQDVDFDTGSHTASPVVAENFQTIYERPIIREDIVEYSRLEQDTSQSSRGYDNEEKQQNKYSAFGAGFTVTESEEHNYYNNDIVNGVY